jgi:hypothetical protein
MKPSGVQFARPIRPPDFVTRANLGSRPGVVWSEHHAEGRQDGVELAVVEGQLLDVGDGERDGHALGPRSVGATVEKARDVVGRRNTGAAPSSGEGGVAVAGRDVEDLLVPVDVARFGKLLTDELEGGADDGVVAARPGGLLATLDGGEIDRDGHVSSS